MDHLEHLSECEVCNKADYVVQLTAFLDFEADMLDQRPQDVGIYDPLLTRMWENEHKVTEVINLVNDENRKFYRNTPGLPNPNIDIPLPPRPDEHE